MDEKSDFSLAVNPKWSHWERKCIEELLGVVAADSTGNGLDDSFDENEFVAPSGLWECFEGTAHDVAALFRGEFVWETFLDFFCKEKFSRIFMEHVSNCGEISNAIVQRKC